MISTKLELLRAVGLLLAAQQSIISLSDNDKTWIKTVLDKVD
ncbi:MAG TPA: hypothetical protein PLA21_07345 [Rectinema sp.]|nr:hypothetical protein [Rectinema sp.]